MVIRDHSSGSVMSLAWLCITLNIYIHKLDEGLVDEGLAWE